MPRFYFDIREGTRFVADHEGEEFDSLDDAEHEAVCAAAEWAGPSAEGRSSEDRCQGVRRTPPARADRDHLDAWIGRQIALDPLSRRCSLQNMPCAPHSRKRQCLTLSV